MYWSACKLILFGATLELGVPSSCWKTKLYLSIFPIFGQEAGLLPFFIEIFSSPVQT